MSSLKWLHYNGFSFSRLPIFTNTAIICLDYSLHRQNRLVVKDLQANETGAFAVRTFS